MNIFTLEHVLLYKKYTNTYPKHNAECSKRISELLIASSTNEINIWFNEKFDLLPILEQGVIVRLKIILDEMFFMSEAFSQDLNTWNKQFFLEGPSKTVGEKIALLMLQLLSYSVRLMDVKKLSI